MRRTFIIPANFMESGYVMSGAISIRNLVEGCVLLLVGFFLCRMLPIPSGIDGISYYILVMGPLGLIGIYGVQGDPLSAFIVDYFKWRRRRKPVFYSNHSEAYTQEAADYLLDSPQFRDFLANALDKVRENLAAEEMVYEEGKTFRFAQDPQQEALRMAQEELQAKRDEEISKALEEQARKDLQAQKQKKQPQHRTSAVDARSIADNLVLENLDWEEDG